MRGSCLLQLCFNMYFEKTYANVHRTYDSLLLNCHVRTTRDNVWNYLPRASELREYYANGGFRS